MSLSDTTCWTVIRGAAEGRLADREEFARRYEPIVRAYLGVRWRGGGLLGEIDDAVQEVFLDCFRDGGALERAEPGRPGGFHAFLHGVVRNVALRAERERAKGAEAQRRVEILKLRFREDLPIREIVERWGIDAARLHHEYASAREEFREALCDVVAEHQPAPRGEVEREAERLIACFR